MMDYETRSDRYDRTEDGFKRFGRWLSRRPGESWAFFIAGLLIAGVLF